MMVFLPIITPSVAWGMRVSDVVWGSGLVLWGNDRRAGHSIGGRRFRYGVRVAYPKEASLKIDEVSKTGETVVPIKTYRQERRGRLVAS